ncbi:MAG: hypothetical protein QY322_03700 [bacterium]|nr:MAG: hypothetical protein QY322_03700 [bacterium]
MTLSIPENLKEEMADFLGSLSDRDHKMLQLKVKGMTNFLRKAARRMPNGCTIGRWDDKGGQTPNEIDTDDTNP